MSPSVTESYHREGGCHKLDFVNLTHLQPSLFKTHGHKGIEGGRGELPPLGRWPGQSAAKILLHGRRIKRKEPPPRAGPQVLSEPGGISAWGIGT